MEMVNLGKREYLLEKIRILDGFAELKESELLANLTKRLESSTPLSFEAINKRLLEITKMIKSRLIDDEYGFLEDKIKQLNNHFQYMFDKDLNDKENKYKKSYALGFDGFDNVLKENMYRLSRLEEQFHRLIDRPRSYEKKAEERLMEIDEKFRSLMKINDKNSSVTEQINTVNQLEEKLKKLETDAQEMLSDISTVQLGKQYLEAKNRYCTNMNKMKFSKSKRFYMRWSLNIYNYLLWILKRIFQTGFFLYLGFISSLLLLTVTYIVLVVSQSTSYKDLALTIPMIWAAWFFQRKINTRDKLYEVYNHKQKVMETYVAFKNSVYTFNAEDKMEEVLLEAIKKDPSDCIGKDNTTLIESLLDKLRGLFVSERVKKIIRNEMKLEK